ncbi:MAG: hypothetical protein HUU16_03845 [Candidatus Omnitrophica bacterium]|nr:hypothetical protein [bacterium]NUN95284.1 hypothetical protein [Candidatus Omnitrophota bacterium]
MEMAKCVRCGKLFNKVRLPVCQPCELEEEKEIFAVQCHLRDHPGESLEEASDALNIYLEDIERWITEKRLTVHYAVGQGLKCLFCGAPIVTGRICAQCAEKAGVTPDQSPRSSRPSTTPARSRRDDDGAGSATKYRRE